jgi:hypothetical protein
MWVYEWAIGHEFTNRGLYPICGAGWTIRSKTSVIHESMNLGCRKRKGAEAPEVMIDLCCHFGTESTNTGLLPGSG